jgi:NADH/F420H2 dehydrogenase subunit C
MMSEKPSEAELSEANGIDAEVAMSAASITLSKLQARFAPVILEQHAEHGDETVTVKRESWREVMQFLRDDPELQYEFLMDLTAVDYLPQHAASRYEVVAHLYSLTHNHRVRLKAPVTDGDARIDSLMPVWEGANWFEREVYDMFGLSFTDHPDLRRILLYDSFEGHPLRKDYPQDKEQPLHDHALDASFYENKRNQQGIETRHLFMHMGPSHPAMHGVIHLILELEGETIIDGDTEIGYLHRAFEKESESHTYTQVIPYTDRLNYVSPLINNVAYVLAVEKLFEVETPERCQYIRVIVSELSRITDHLTCIAANAMELGAFTVFFYFIKAREHLQAGGNRMWGSPHHHVHAGGRGDGRSAGDIRTAVTAGLSHAGRIFAGCRAHARNQPHFLRSHARHGHYQPGRRGCPQFYRPGLALHRRALRRAQDESVSRLRPPRL